jgi:hypothetical protein
MNRPGATTPYRFSLGRLFRAGRYFLLASLLAASPAEAIELRVGNNYPLTFTDVDRHQLSTADGHVTIITVVTRRDEDKAQAVGDGVPRMYYGDPKFRLITLVNFQQSIFPPFRGMLSAIIRRRLDDEAKELQKTYTERHLTRNPRDDIFVIADYDGKAVSQLGLAPTSSEFAVFIFDGRGRLVRRWSDVPSADALAQGILEAR